MPPQQIDQQPRQEFLGRNAIGTPVESVLETIRAYVARREHSQFLAHTLETFRGAGDELTAQIEGRSHRLRPHERVLIEDTICQLGRLLAYPVADASRVSQVVQRAIRGPVADQLIDLEPSARRASWSSWRLSRGDRGPRQ